MRAPTIALISLVLGACASAPPAIEHAAPAAGDETTLIDLSGSGALPVGAFVVDVDGRLPGEASTDARLAGRVTFRADEPLRYHVDYSLTPGDVLTGATEDAVSAGLARIGAQSFAQTLELATPALAGAPVGFHLSSQSIDSWTTSTHSRVQQDVAQLSWAPGSTALDLQWRSVAEPTDPALALGCDVLGSIQLPTSGAEARSTGNLRLSGRSCEVLSDDGRFAALSARTLGVQRTWAGAAGERQVQLSMIAPAWDGDVGSPNIEPSYQVGVRMRRDHRTWSAAAGASVREAGAWAASPAEPLTQTGTADVAYATDVTLIRNLGAAVVSTTWMHGANPLWFVPAAAAGTDRFDVSVDLSRWAQELMPAMTPRVGVTWNWWATQLTDDTAASSETTLVLQLSLPL